MTDGGAISKQGKRIRQVLEQLEASLGHGLTAEDVVQAATSPEHLLHEYFEWDDAKAGHEYRKDQARGLMRRVQVRIVEHEPTGERKVFQMAGYSNVVRDDRREYVPTAQAFLDPTLRQQIVLRALREMEQWTRRYQTFVELAGIIEAVHAIRQQIDPVPAAPAPRPADVRPRRSTRAAS